MRVKAGDVTRFKHRKVLKATKGFRGTYSKTFKRAHEAFMHAGMYSYKQRRKRTHQFRRLWITRLSNMLSKMNYGYSKFISDIKAKKIEINRKMLSEVAVNMPEVFNKIVEVAKK